VTTPVTVRVFVQARMTSRRFPGKVLAPFRGAPLLGHLLDRLRQKVSDHEVVVATSTDATDDPIETYVRSRGIDVFRGDLGNVVARFQACLRTHPCEWFFRVCGDSPLVNVDLLDRMRACASTGDPDLVTNVFPRTFPKGQSLELLRSRTFVALDPGTLDADQREHVTKVYYDRPDRYRIVNITSGDPSLASTSVAVDTIEDLVALASEAPGVLR
jgi:spore coat polysaccharide biosynthesis protein SpsF